MIGFEEAYGRAPDAVADAPGRVNLPGEHTDCNNAFVLPTAISRRTRVAIAAAAEPVFSLHAQSLGQRVEFTLDAPGWRVHLRVPGRAHGTLL